MKILETERLQILEFTKEDAPFILELVNEPAWKEFIGDKNINNVHEAAHFIEHKLRPSYKEHGFGLFLVKLKEKDIAIGMCGLVNRPRLENIDIGFAFLASHRKKGYAFESSKAMIHYAKDTLKIPTLVAITNLNNVASGKLLEKLGFTFDTLIDLAEDGKDVCKLFVQKETS